MQKNTDVTRKILIWMLAGLMVGSVINMFAANQDWVRVYFTDGLFHVIGAMFVSLLKMLVVPLVTFSLICGVCGLGDINKLGRVGGKSLGLFLLTTALAISLAIALALIVEPGKGFDLTANTSTFVAPEAPPLTQVLIDLIPSNPVAAFASGNMLQIIFFVVMFGICVVMLGERGKPIVDLSSRLNDIMMQLVTLVMQVAPYGVFALMAKAFANQGLGLIVPMFAYFSVVVLALLLHLTGTLMILLKVFGRVNPWMFLRKMREVQLFAFSTSSSNATLPVTLKTAEQRLGVDNSTASFVVPLGATINMDGTAIMQGVATVFIANVYGVELGVTGYLVVIAMAVLASIGTAGVPGVGLIMLAMVLHQVGLPVEGIALIMGVDRLLDMMRTAVNVTGDAMVSVIVAGSENTLDRQRYDDPRAGDAEEVVHLPHGDAK
ncbi:MAG: dicarboxylate/amino acid:cation symporter [Gammaproteobacteria bacterium]|nr:dicarboxylate/amino acid:cation symporter [Gammaproteobacteria bacterium]